MGNIKGAEVLMMQGARASTTIILVMIDQNNTIPAREGLIN